MTGADNDPVGRLLGLFDTDAAGRPVPAGNIELIRQIATMPSLAAQFREKIAPAPAASKRELKSLLKTVSAGLDREAGYAENWVDLLDRYVAPMSGSAVVAAIIASFAQRWDGGPLIAAIGASALAVAGFIRFWVKSKAISDKHEVKLIDLLADM